MPHFACANAKSLVMLGVANPERLLLFPGGMAIISAKELIGALEISGMQNDKGVALGEKILHEVGGDFG